MNASGRPRVETEILDISVLVATGLKGIIALIGPTERGDIGTSRLVSNWTEYRKYFGGLLSTSDFPLLVRRILEAGGKCRVSRAGHYTDEEDASTLVGTAATCTLGSAGNTELFTAASIGTWANTNLAIAKTAAANGATGEVDYTITLVGYPELTQVIKNLPLVATAQSQATFNSQAKLCQMTTIVGTGAAVDSDVFATGAQDVTAIVDADYIGNSGAQTGIHAFDNATDFVKIAIPHLAIPAIDIALAAYVDTRKDCRAIIRTPISIDGSTAVDYREGEGVYVHTPIDSWRTSLVFGSLNIIDPRTNTAKVIPAIADVLGCHSKKDNAEREWFSAAGARNGRIGNTTGTDYNLGSPARATEFDNCVNHGINAVIDDAQFGTCYWGNRTLWKANTLLQAENIADLMVFLERTLAPSIRMELFRPDDLITWKNIYRRVQPIMDEVKSQRGCYDWKYEGDQNIDKIEDATINQSEDLAAGKYTFYLWVKPIRAMEYISIKVVVTEAGVSLTISPEELGI